MSTKNDIELIKILIEKHRVKKGYDCPLVFIQKEFGKEYDWQWFKDHSEDFTITFHEKSKFKAQVRVKKNANINKTETSKEQKVAEEQKTAEKKDETIEAIEEIFRDIINLKIVDNPEFEELRKKIINYFTLKRSDK